MSSENREGEAIGAFSERTCHESESSGNGRAKQVTEDDGKERSSEEAQTSSSIATQDDHRELSSLDDRERSDNTGTEEFQDEARFKQEEASADGETGDGDDDVDDEADDDDDEDDYDISDNSGEMPHARRESKRKTNLAHETRQDRIQKVAKLESDLEEAIREQQSLLQANRNLSCEVSSFVQQLQSMITPSTVGDSGGINASGHFSLQVGSTNDAATLQADQHVMETGAHGVQNEQVQLGQVSTNVQFSSTTSSSMLQQQIPLALPPRAASAGSGVTDANSVGARDQIRVSLNHKGNDNESSYLKRRALQVPVARPQQQSSPRERLLEPSQILQDDEKTTGSSTLAHVEHPQQQQLPPQQQQQQQPLQTSQQSPIEVLRRAGIEDSNPVAQADMQSQTLGHSSQQHPPVRSQQGLILNLQQPQPQLSSESMNIVTSMLRLASGETNLDLTDPNTLELIRHMLADRPSQEDSKQG